MHHRLLITGLVITKVGVLLQGLTDTRHIAVPKNPKTTREKWLFISITLHTLIFQERDNGLGRG